MSFLHSTVLSDAFLWDIINSHISDRRRGTGGAAFNINCPLCISRGYTPDKTHRCGVFHSADSIGVNCFNCQFKTRFSIGRKLSGSMQKFLEAIGVPEREVKQIKLRCHQLAGFVEKVTEQQPDFRPTFDAIPLPDDAKTIQQWVAEDCQDPNYLDVVDYLLSRGDVAAGAIPYYWSPDPEHELNRKLIIPCFHDDRLVGWVGRCIDGGKRKYYTQIPKNFLFNSKAISHPFRKYIFIVEGYFDALVVDGVAAMGVSLNDNQIRWINGSGKTPVVIPDRDQAGQALTRIAVKQGWAVAMPNFGGRQWWDDDIKDVDEAVLRHGRLYTVQSIVASMTDDTGVIIQRSKYYI